MKTIDLEKSIKNQQTYWDIGYDNIKKLLGTYAIRTREKAEDIKRFAWPSKTLPTKEYISQLNSLIKDYGLVYIKAVGKETIVNNDTFKDYQFINMINDGSGFCWPVLKTNVSSDNRCAFNFSPENYIKKLIQKYPVYFKNTKIYCHRTDNNNNNNVWLGIYDKSISPIFSYSTGSTDNTRYNKKLACVIRKFFKSLQDLPDILSSNIYCDYYREVEKYCFRMEISITLNRTKDTINANICPVCYIVNNADETIVIVISFKYADKYEDRSNNQENEYKNIDDWWSHNRSIEDVLGDKKIGQWLHNAMCEQANSVDVTFNSCFPDIFRDIACKSTSIYSLIEKIEYETPNPYIEAVYIDSKQTNNNEAPQPAPINPKVDYLDYLFRLNVQPNISGKIIESTPPLNKKRDMAIADVRMKTRYVFVYSNIPLDNSRVTDRLFSVLDTLDFSSSNVFEDALIKNPLVRKNNPSGKADISKVIEFNNPMLATVSDEKNRNSGIVRTSYFIYSLTCENRYEYIDLILLLIMAGIPAESLRLLVAKQIPHASITSEEANKNLQIFKK